MDAVVDPAADGLWESVATIATAAGIEERQPRTDEEWAAVRRHGIALMEATNLLLMNRRVARDGGAFEAGVELPPAEIEERIRADRDAWVSMVHGLYDAVQPSLRAIEARDPQALLNAGGGLDEACENCHRKYWYPDNPSAPALPPKTAP
jgi:hypothetical protein